MANNRGTKASFGNIRRLPSGRYQARYVGPDERSHRAPTTFETKGDAEAWLSIQRAAITTHKWLPDDVEAPKSPILADYFARWSESRPIKPRTGELYRSIYNRHIGPAFGTHRLMAITSTEVRAWNNAMRQTTGPTGRAHAYALLKTIPNTAIEDEILNSNPCRIRGAASVKRATVTKPATLTELDSIISDMPEKYAAMTLIAAWCGLRFGELIELRRSDIDMRTQVIHVRRGAVRVEGKIVIGTPKSDAGIRDVSIPPHLMPPIEQHMRRFVAPGKTSLLFPAIDGRHLSPTALHRVFARARENAGRPDLRWHDLRHTGAVLAASTGATLAELMSRFGHSTPAAALRYQHAAAGRDAVIAAKLSELAGGTL